eukprot:CAMPEP_0194219854 /NCGR_PEP_ID=MMETSP0156-20130528/26999_1 /TAXON_ID=33649 /ORGANISM="Thalassionema nitzschioides, Strain L26-B" /LENGTH=401 /DNA_ID=CAMNT_0038949667 /DNA_START=86 /DNA_END=1291 /DNA_ORIENTATION=+
MVSPSLRKRKSKSKSKKEAAEASIQEELKTSHQGERTTFMEHAKNIALITAVFMIPYGLSLLYPYLYLQRPDIVALLTMGKVQLRPAITLTEPRQVLIVGTMSSGTSQIANELSKTMGLEVGHENAEASWSFVRDGVVSWFHGIRFLPREAASKISADDKFKLQAMALCRSIDKNMGFHPLMFRNSETCSVRQSWGSDCWRNECMLVLNREWSCALNGTCDTPYRRTLLQVRSPLRTIESLVAKFCHDNPNDGVYPAFIKYATALFPQHHFKSLSCAQAAGYYVVEYYNAMLQAHSKGLIDGFYRVEESTPCHVARMAGFLDAHDVVYTPNQKHTSDICDGNPDHDANKVMKSNINQRNKGRVTLQWSDLVVSKNGNAKKDEDLELLTKVKKLSVQLGYDV